MKKTIVILALGYLSALACLAQSATRVDFTCGDAVYVIYEIDKNSPSFSIKNLGPCSLRVASHDKELTVIKAATVPPQKSICWVSPPDTYRTVGHCAENCKEGKGVIFTYYEKDCSIISTE